MYSVRLCVKTSVDTLIAESFKIDMGGKMIMIRAKEITGWILEFLEDMSKTKVKGKDYNVVEVHNDSDREMTNSES
jgi:hypothetical protein